MDTICYDIGPYLLLGVMRQHMIPNCDGGIISQGLSKVLQAVQLDRLFDMATVKHFDGDVFPFPLKTGARESTDETHFGVTTKQRAVDQFVRALEGWLAKLELGISPDGRGHIGEIIGEAIDNAERHSGGTSGEGRWWMAGFMTTRYKANGAATYHCHFGLLSLGCSIADSILLAPDEIRKQVVGYTQKHKSKNLSEGTLAATYALQDGITRQPPGGVGMMSLLDMVSVLGKTDKGVKASVAIVSGDACILAREPYIQPSLELSDARTLWFNESNSESEKPSEDFVKTLPYNFPGTLVTLRFQIDPDHLKRLVRGSKRKHDNN